MEIPENEDEFLYQGSSYEEGVADKSARKKGSSNNTESDSDNDVIESSGSETSEVKTFSKPKFDVGLLKNKAVLIGAGCILLVIVILLIGSSSAKKREEEELARAEELLAGAEEPAFMYMYDELEALRLAGYTGNEIEQYERDEVPASDLVNAAKAARKAQYEAELAPYFDSASDEFMEVYRHTWLGQEDLVFDTDSSRYEYYETTMNVDYRKLPAKGHQLFIEYYLSNGDTCFMTVTPEKYLQLDDTGNIVLKIYYTKTADGSKIVTGAEEVEVK